VNELTETYLDLLRQGRISEAKAIRVNLIERLLQLANSIGTEQTTIRTDPREL
jgi:hypothetical protein